MSARLTKVNLAISVSALSLCAIVANKADAQATPPARFATDANGVDLARGTIQSREAQLSIGAGRSSLIYYVSPAGGVLPTPEYDLSAYQSSSTQVSFPVLGPDGVVSKIFNVSGSTYTSALQDGSTLVLSGTDYILKLSDGTQYKFATNLQSSDSARIARAYEIKYPMGEVVTISYLYTSPCTNPNQAGCSGSNPPRINRLTSVVSSFGYGLHFDYQSNTVSSTSWKLLSKVTAFNAKVDNCTGASVSCTFTRAWPSVSYQTGQAADGSTLLVTDTLGRTTTYTSGVGRSAIRRPGSSADNRVITSSAGGGPITSVMLDGRTWQYGFTFAGNVATAVIANPDGTSRTVISDRSVGLPTKVTDEVGNVTSYLYDSAGRLSQSTAPDGQVATYFPDNRGNVRQTRVASKTPGTPPDIVTLANYSDPCVNAVTCNSPVTTTDARGYTSTYSYDPTFGAVTKITAPLVGGISAETRYTYGQPLTGSPIYMLTAISACQSLSTCAGTADEVKQTLAYDANGLISSVTRAAGDGSVVSTTSLAYDAVGNLTSSDGPLAGAADTTTFSYDAMRQRLTSVGPDPDGPGPLKRRAVTSHYRGDGVVDTAMIGTTDATGSVFTPLQQVDSALTNFGQLISTTLSAGGVAYGKTGYGYDVMGRVICTAVRMDPSQWNSQTDYCTPQISGPNGPDRVEQRGYDEAGRLKIVVNALGTADASTERLSYLSNGQVGSVTDANLNVTTYGYDGFARLQTTTFPGGSYEQLGYDPNGNVTSRRLRDGNTIAYGYDALNRAMSQTMAHLTTDDQDIVYSYDNLGRLIAASKNGANQTRLGWDALGRKTTESNYYYNVSSQYNAAGQRTRLTWGDGFYVTYEYNAAGGMTAIRENGGLALASFGYDDLGRRTSLTRGNGTVTTYGYDGASRLTTLGLDLAGSGYDQSYGFGYNPAGQITTRTASNDVYAWTGAMNVDRPYSVNALNQYTQAGSTSFGYDGRGNLASSGSTNYQYTSQNRLAASSIGGILYADSLERLDYIAAEGVLVGHDGADATTEVSYNGNVGPIARRYVFGAGSDEPLVWYEGAGTSDRRYLHADERGSIVAVSDNAGAKIAINSYDEYGIPGPNNQGRFQYTGQKWIPGIGLYDYKARMYSPTLGRFMQTDPIGYGAGLNKYNYVGGDPINSTDPSGLSPCPAGTPPGTLCASFPGSPSPSPSPQSGGGGFFLNPVPIVKGIVCLIFGCKKHKNTGTPAPAISSPPSAPTAVDLQSSSPNALASLGKLVCSVGNLDVGGGADVYAGLGGSVGGSGKVDLTTGQFGIDGYVAVGAGLGAEAGPTVTFSSSGSSIVTANVITQVGGGYGVGVVGTRTLLGTGPGQSSVTVGKVGSPIGFANGGAAIGLHTPKLYDLGC